MSSHTAYRRLATLSTITFLMSGTNVMAQSVPDPEEVVATFEKVGGVHKGIRRNHAKGTCASGSFQGTAEARALSASALFSGQEIPLVARFSLAGPNPAAPDTTKNPRGLAIQFRLPGGELHQMAMLSTPVFGAATVESFYARLQADVPDAAGKRDPEKLKAYVATHPDNGVQATWLSSHNPPASFANTAYYSLNAFKFVNASKQGHWVKWRFEPQDGIKFLSDDELKAAPRDFLIQAITERAHKGHIKWDMIITLGEDGDPLDNPSVAWPNGRREVKAGTLSISVAGADAAGQCEDINFDPNLLSSGVEPSPDTILAYRSGAYGVSYSKRTEEKGR